MPAGRSPHIPSKMSTKESNNICQDFVPIEQAVEPIIQSCTPSRYCTNKTVSGQCKAFNPRDQVKSNMTSLSCGTPNLITLPLPLEQSKTISTKNILKQQPQLCSPSPPSIEANPHESTKSPCTPGSCVKYGSPFFAKGPSKPPPELLIVSSSGRSFVTPRTNVQNEPAILNKPCAPILSCIPCSAPVSLCRPSVSSYHLVPCSVSGPCQPSYQFYNSPPELNQLSVPQVRPFRPCVPLCQPDNPYIAPCDSSKQSFELSKPPCNLCTPCGTCLEAYAPCYGTCNPCPLPMVPCRPCFESFTPSCELVCFTPTQYSCNSGMVPGCVPICNQCIPCNVPCSIPRGSCCVLNPENCSLRNNGPPFCCAGSVVKLPVLSQ